MSFGLVWHCVGMVITNCVPLMVNSDIINSEITVRVFGLSFISLMMFQTPPMCTASKNATCLAKPPASHNNFGTCLDQWFFSVLHRDLPNNYLLVWLCMIRAVCADIYCLYIPYILVYCLCISIYRPYTVSTCVHTVPSSNKRDLRSIEETLKDLRSKKRAKMEHGDELQEDEQAHRTETDTSQSCSDDNAI